MSEEDTIKTVTLTENEMIELAAFEALKAQANALGISFHPNIGKATLKEKVDKFRLEQEKDQVEIVTAKPREPAVTKEALARAEALKLVRVEITCMDPSKSEYEGEIFSAGNSVVPTQKRYVPFAVPWHVPQIIFNMIEAKEYLGFISKKVPGGASSKEKRLTKTYAVRVLDPLTPQELKDLGQRQAMAKAATA